MTKTAAPKVWRYFGTKPIQSFSPVPAKTSATSSSAVLRRRPRKSVSLRLIPTVSEIVEQRHAISLRPEADHSSLCEGFIIPVECFLPIECDREMIAAEIDAQGVPFAGLHLHVRSFLLGALAFDRVVNAYVIFKCVRAGNVVVVGVLGPPDNASRLIVLAR